MIHDVVIYKANETNFNHEGLGVLIDFVEDVEVTENNRGFFELKFTYSLNGKLAQSIKEEAYIKTVANERQEEPLIFRIYQCEPDYIERLIYVRARLKIIDDMMNSVHKSIVFPKSFGITPIIEGLFKNAVPSLNYRLSGSVNNLHDISHEDDTVYEHLFQENGLFVMNDITPLYTPLGMTITTTRGNKLVDTITEQDFINKFKIIRERKNMITAIIPWTVTKRDEFVANEEDARRSYRDTVEEKVYGEIIVSPKVASHGYPFIAKFMEFKNEVTREWEENNRTMREYKYQSVEDLNKASQNFFTENKGMDEYSIEASIETLGLHMDYMKRLSSLGLYDEVEFYLEEHDLKIVLAVSEVTYSPSLDMNLALTFQSNTSTLSKAGQRINANAPSERDLQNLIERERLKEIVRNYIDKDDGTRTYWVSELLDPATAAEQDIAFLETAEGKSIWVFINGVWVEKLPLNFEERLRDELERVDTQTQALEAAIQANEAKARKAFEQAGASADLANEAQRIADETKQAHATLSQEVIEAKADLVQKGLELSHLTENFGVTERKVEELDGAIKEAVTRADYDALTGRLSQAETIIQSQAGKISQQLTRTEVESLVNQKDYLSASVFNNYKTETAQSLTQRFEEVRGLIPTEVGGRNLIRNGAFPEDLVHWRDYNSSNFTTAKHDFYYSGAKNIFVLQTNGTREVMVSSNRFELKRNTDYTLSFYGFMSSNTSNIDVLLLGQKKDETADFTSALNIIDKRRLNESGMEYVTATFNSGEVDTAFLRFDNNGSTNGSMSWFFFGEVMLVEGKIARTWEAALADLEGLTDSKIAIYKQTVDGQFADLSNRYADKTEFAKVQTTAKLSEQIFGATDKDGAITNISREILSSSIYQTEVTNAVRGNIIENGAYMTTTDHWGDVDLSTHSFYKDGKVNMFVITTNQARERVGYTKHYKVKRNTDYSFSSIVFASSNVSSVDVYALGRRTGETSNFTIIRQLIRERKASPSNVEYWTGTFNTGEMDELFLRFDNNGSTNGLNALLFFTEVTLTEGSIPKPWSVPIAETVAMSTKVTQLADSWAVQHLNANGDVLSAINLATGGASIQAGTNKLVVTPTTTYIQDGTIKSTHIGTAQINTAHISEIDASRARIINLDVNSLTGDHARFLRVLLNGANSSVKLDGRELAIMRTDNTYAAKFHENGLTLFRDGIKVGSLMSLNAVETYGYYNNLRSISLTTEPGSYIGFSYYSSQDDVYYRAFALGGDGRLRFHSPLYDGISNYGFRLGNTTMGTQKASTWRDTISGGGLIVTIDMDTHLSMSNGQWINITRIWDNLQSCIRRIESLESAARSSNRSYTPPTTSTTPSKPVAKTLQVGTIVKIKPHITYYYDENDNRITIPENKNGRNYRLETYTIGKIATNSRVAKYCLYLEGWAIAWVTPDLVDIQ